MKTTTDVQIGKIAMVIVYSKDPMASLPFYRDLLGMKVQEESPHWVQLDGGGVSLAIHEHPKMPATREDALPWVVFHVERHPRGVRGSEGQGREVPGRAEAGLRRRQDGRAIGRPPRPGRQPPLPLRDGPRRDVAARGVRPSCGGRRGRGPRGRPGTDRACGRAAAAARPRRRA